MSSAEGGTDDQLIVAKAQVAQVTAGTSVVEMLLSSSRGMLIMIAINRT